METETRTKARETYWISLDQIDFHPSYFNRHSAEDIEAMARDILEGGQINPIEVRLKPDDRYEIITGGGRYQAIQSLRGATKLDKWKVIECTIRTDSDDEYQEWSRRLSENLIRTASTWIEQALYFAKMKASGDVTAKIAERYRMSEAHVRSMIAVGEIPTLANLTRARPCKIDVSFREVEKFILPLRIQTGREPQQGNVPIWDYSEVTTCIDKLANGELSREDLPTYSAERREAIGKARAEKVEKSDNSEAAKLQKKLDEFREAAKNRETHESKKIEDLEQKNLSLATAMQRLESSYKALEEKISIPEGETEEIKRLQEELETTKKALDEANSSVLQQKVQESSTRFATFDMSAFPEVVANIRQQVEEELRAKGKEQGIEFPDEEIKRKREELEAREAELAEKEKLFREKQIKDMDSDAQDFDTWVHLLEKARQEYLRWIGIGKIKVNEFRTRMDGDDLKRLFTQFLEVRTKMDALLEKYTESYGQEGDQQDIITIKDMPSAESKLGKHDTM